MNRTYCPRCEGWGVVDDDESPFGFSPCPDCGNEEDEATAWETDTNP